MEQSQAQKRFGTFSGVFTPSILTIFGVIMFLRTGFVVGNAGVLKGVMIIVLAEAIVLLTALSISAIATNVEVKIGGAYFLISRSLGAEFGGAIGLVLYFSQAISVAFYIVGFTEAFLAAFSGFPASFREVALFVCAVLFVITFIGAGWAIKTQFIILAALGVSIASFLTSASLNFQADSVHANLSPGFIEGMSLWKAFAIFFPAVTGILAGVNMSGDLRNPQKNIPRGVLAAISVSALVYIGIAVLMAGNFQRETLIGDSMAIRLRSIVPFSVFIGVFAATLSSAIGSFMGAPRVLQAMASDEVFRRFRLFAKGSSRTNEPRRAIVLTFAIAAAGIMIGDLNVIAPVITMFFLITYGMLNFATLYETLAGNPSFRPRFRLFHWSTALLGVLGCLAGMVLINLPYALVSLVFIVIIYQYVGRRAIATTWGDAKAGFLFARTRETLLRLDRKATHPKNWRPSILVMSGNPHLRLRLVQLARWLEAGKGLIILGNIISGKFADQLSLRQNQEEILKKFIRDNKLEAFYEVIVAEDFESGFVSLVQAAGVGMMKPNTVMFGLSFHPERYETFGKILRATYLLEKNIIVVKPASQEMQREKTIDIWWRGEKNGALMTLFAFLLKLNHEWHGHKIRIFRVVSQEEDKAPAAENLRTLIDRARIEAASEVILSSEPIFHIIEKVSQRSSLVFMGLNIPEEGKDKEFFRQLAVNLENLPTVLAVKSVLDENIILS
jgi:amino acid transporter